MTWSLAEEREFRIDLFRVIDEWAMEGDGTLSRYELGHVDFGGGLIFRCIDPQGGIWNPGPSWPLENQLRGTLSINTTNREVYSDREVSENVWQYDYQRGSDEGKNIKLREAYVNQLPIFWFRQIENNRYVPMLAYVIKDNREESNFLISPAPEMASSITAELTPIAKSYAIRNMKQRLHQPLFRSRVLNAYGTTCAICRLKHGRLLDAAHITPDSDVDSTTEVSNGLSLCKIHHAAYDANFLGIDANYRVHIRKDLLNETDGPMLQHGLKEMDQISITLPKREEWHPDKIRLDAQFEKFLKIGPFTAH